MRAGDSNGKTWFLLLSPPIMSHLEQNGCTYLFSFLNFSVRNNDNLLLLLESHHFSNAVWLKKRKQKKQPSVKWETRSLWNNLSGFLIKQYTNPNMPTLSLKTENTRSRDCIVTTYTARVVDVTGGSASHRSIDHGIRVDSKHVHTAILRQKNKSKNVKRS